jgi:hypothetical protein
LSGFLPLLCLIGTRILTGQDRSRRPEESLHLPVRAARARLRH